MAAACVAGAAAAGTIEVTTAGGEYAAAHPRRAEPAAADDFDTTMNRVFGAGRWRKTSGYRTPAQENALRRQGAGTVAAGRLSMHSIGGADAPGAFDAVVDRMPVENAAARLRRAGAPFARVAPERAHGRQGAHLHIELARKGASSDGDEAVGDNPKPRRGRST